MNRELSQADRSRLESNLTAVRAAIARACHRCGRRIEDVTLVAVTKYAPPEVVPALADLGQFDLGESRPQSLWERAASAPEGVRWHLIGSLQTNKVRRTLPLVHCIHSLDRAGLAEALAAEARRIDARVGVFVEVNLTNDATKQGYSRESLLGEFPRLAEVPELELLGLMGMAPASEDPREARATFCEIRRLRDDLRDSTPSAGRLDALSMGMSGDFEIAIEEGSTHVRVGSALFEGLSSPEFHG